MSATELLMHVDEELSPDQRRQLLDNLGNPLNGMQPKHQTNLPHLMFVAYNTEDFCPHDLVDMAAQSGVHAQVIDL